MDVMMLLRIGKATLLFEFQTLSLDSRYPDAVDAEPLAPPGRQHALLTLAGY
jgi:hypothetical protein